NAPAAGGFDGDELPYVPKFSNSLDAASTWKAFGGYNAFAGVTWSYIGSRVIGFGVVSTPTGMPAAEPRPALGGYDTTKRRAGGENGRWSCEVNCKNPAASRGRTSCG